MVLRMVIGAVVGVLIGGTIGYFGKCAGGGCPLTGSPLGGALWGLVLGLMFAGSFSGRSGTEVEGGGDPGNVQEISSSEALDTVIGEGGVVLVDFFASWCGPCRKLKPVIANLSTQYEEGVTFLAVKVR